MAKKRSAGVFEPFIEETMGNFGFLIRDFGFEHYKTSIVSYECVIAFRKDDVVGVHVYCEMGAIPWVMMIGRIGKRTEEAALDFVIRLRCPDRELDWQKDLPASTEDVREVLRHDASALRECAPDFLKGDPSVLREVRPAVDEDYKLKLREMRREERQASTKKKQTKKTRTS